MTTYARDSAGDDYVELDMTDTEQVRVTYLLHQEWAGGPVIRIQKHAYTGRLSPGPEFPAEKAPELIAALLSLVAKRE